MINLDKENFKIETDCKTVGEFMTEAAAFGCGILSINVDGCLYEFYDNPKIRVTDNTPIGSVSVDNIGSGGVNPDVVRITVLTKPKPKAVLKLGWVNIYYDGIDRYCGYIWDTKDEVEVLSDSDNYVTTTKIEWEEVEK